MRIAISVPDPIFEAAEELAKRLNISRSQLYAQAVEVFVRTRHRLGITEAVDRIYAKESSGLDPQWSAAQAASLSADEW
jgi:metal-responsive CopG/Arc/MetJ family transcriptional regulator